MNNLYKHKSGIAVELIAIANSTADDGRPITAVYRVLKTNECFTENANTFSEEFVAISDLEVDEQLKGINFVA